MQATACPSMHSLRIGKWPGSSPWQSPWQAAFTGLYRPLPLTITLAGQPVRARHYAGEAATAAAAAAVTAGIAAGASAAAAVLSKMAVRPAAARQSWASAGMQ